MSKKKIKKIIIKKFSQIFLLIEFFIIIFYFFIFFNYFFYLFFLFFYFFSIQGERKFFKRVDEEKYQREQLPDNSFNSKRGDQWGKRAAEDLGKVKGKRFQTREDQEEKRVLQGRKNRHQRPFF